MSEPSMPAWQAALKIKPLPAPSTERREAALIIQGFIDHAEVAEARVKELEEGLARANRAVEEAQSTPEDLIAEMERLEQLGLRP